MDNSCLVLEDLSDVLVAVVIARNSRVRCMIK